MTDDEEPGRIINERDAILSKYEAEVDEWHVTVDRALVGEAALELMPELNHVLHFFRPGHPFNTEKKDGVKEALALIEKFYVDLGAPVCPSWDDDLPKKTPNPVPSKGGGETDLKNGKARVEEVTGTRMTDKELVEAFGALRTLCTNIIGFHIEAERESNDATVVQRVMYEAQAHAGGLVLANRVFRIAEELERRTP